jgi:electron transport complex protein RnfG
MTRTASKPITLVLAVAVTCVAAAAGLGATYGITADRIAEQDRLAQEKSLKSAMPDATTFEEVTDEAFISKATAAAGEVQVKGVFRALDGGGEPIGWGLRLGSRGYGGYAQLVIGLDTSGKVTGVSVLSHGETPGLGTKVMDNPEYLARFAKLPEGFTSKDVRGIDAVAGATKSSNSVRHAVEAAGAVYTEVLSKGGE